MKYKSKKTALCLASAVAALVASPGVAFAQDQVDADSQNDEVIVVTGTLIRGIAPAGASPVTVSEAEIDATGATTVAQVLETIPQLGSFGSLQQPLAANQVVSVNRPNLRRLPGFNTSGGSTTLVLLDGHRLVGMGNASTTPDPDIIPPGVIARVEIVPDGGSAIYGSDAVAGVINFVTIKRFDGLKVDASYGLADDYYRYDANVTGGRDWGSGSVFASYNYAKSDQLLGGERDYVREFPGSNGFTNLSCDPGNIETLAGAYGTPARTIVGLPAGVATAPNQCDVTEFATLFPASERHSVFAGLTQELNDSITLEIRGYYTNRQTVVQGGPYRASQLLVPQPLTAALQGMGVPAISSPFSTLGFGGFVNGQPVFVPNSPNTVDLVQQVYFQFGPNDALRTDIELDTWGITPTIIADLDGNFQLRVLGSYGESAANFRGAAINEGALRNAITSGDFNPFDPASSNPAAVADITNFQTFGRTRQYYHNFRAIVDGDLFELPGGAVKIAVGVEYANEEFDTQNGTTIPGMENTGFAGAGLVPAQVPIPRFNLDRNVKSAFGEIVAPVFGTDGGPSLTVSIAGRYDDYSDVGSTFNPRFGATFKPVDWVSIFGAWGKSFNAPSLADDVNAAPSRVNVLVGASAAFFAPPADLVADGTFPAYTGGLIVAQAGNVAGILPQKAKTWTLGFDMQPPMIPGLNIGATYYNISFDNQIGLAPFESPARLYRDFANLITISPTQAQIDAALAGADIIIGPTSAPASGTYAFFDARKRNLGRVKVDGIDFRLNYNQDTSFGSVFFNTRGTYTLNLKRSNTATSPFFETIDANESRLAIRTTAGAEVGPVLGQVTWNHRQGFDVSPSVGFVPQTEVGDFNTFDLFFKYDVKGTGLFQDLAFTLNVANVFDQDPPLYRGNLSVAGQNGYTNGATLGRLFQFGVSKKF